MIAIPGTRAIGGDTHVGYGFFRRRRAGKPRPTHLRFCPQPVSAPPDAPGGRTRSTWRMSAVVVVGNGVSGYACAARLAEREVPVTMIGPGLPHDRPPLSKRALVTGRVPLLADAAQLAERGIEHVDGVVTACDLERRRLVVTSSDGGGPLEIEAPTLVWATGLRYPKPPVPGLRAGRREHDRGGSRLARPAPGPPAQARRRGRRRADRHRDRRDARGGARRDARRHARPPPRTIPPARVRFSPRGARRTRRALPRLVQDRLGELRCRGRRRAHLDARRPSLRRRRLGGRLPFEPPARARRRRRQDADPTGGRAPARDRARALLGLRRLRLVPAPTLGPHRHPALGSRALERPPRRRVDPRLDRALRARAVLLQRHRPPPHPAGRPQRRGRRVAATTTGSSSAATREARPPACSCSTRRRACARLASSSPQPNLDH